MPTKKPKQPKPRTPSKKLPDPVHVPQPRPEHVPVQQPTDYERPDHQLNPVPQSQSIWQRFTAWACNH